VLTLNDLTRELGDNSELYDMSKEDGDEAGLLTIEEETAKLRGWSSAACSTTRPTR
jgi:peptide chain release factor 2